VEAARLAKAAGRPVRLVWTREEEFTWAYFRPAGVIEVAGGATKDGRLLMGSPITTSLDVTPDVLPPGTSTVTNMLHVSLGSSSFGGSLELVGQLAINDALKGSIGRSVNLLYLLSSNNFHIVDISNPTTPLEARVKAGGGSSLVARNMPMTAQNTISDTTRGFVSARKCLSRVSASASEVKAAGG